MINQSLRYFSAIARHGSIREAAEELHIAQSALSRQIQKLEEDFGVPLFQRHARGVKLTSAGEIFLRHAQTNLRQIERVRSEIDALQGLRRGTVSIHSIESLVPHLLPRAVTRFSTALSGHPVRGHDRRFRPGGGRRSRGPHRHRSRLLSARPRPSWRRCSRCASPWSR